MTVGGSAGTSEEVMSSSHGLPCKEGGAINDARAPTVCDGAEASFHGTTLVEGALPNSEIMQWIKEAMEPSRDDAGAPSISSIQCQGILQCYRN
jgi:hypothetical protein